MKSLKFKICWHLILPILILFSITVQAQVTSFVENFQTPLDTSAWKSGNNGSTTTFPLKIEDGALRVDYIRNASSNPWDQFNLSFENAIDASSTRLITMKIKSDISFTISVKPIYTTGDDWLQKTVEGGNEWRTYYFSLSNKSANPITQIYFYFNGGSNSEESATVFIDDLNIGSNASLPLDKQLLIDAIKFGKKLHTLASYGNGVGQFPVGSQNTLITKITEAEAKLGLENIKQKTIDSLAHVLNDESMLFESKINMPNNGLADSLATRQTKMLYSNLKKVMDDPKFMYGHHDPTDYGVGWVNNGSDRSDVKDVSGSHPAVYSWDFFWIDNVDRLNYFRKLVMDGNSQGAIQTFCWHQRDPTGTSFYQSDLDYKVVPTILPGGANHAFYKTNLKKVADLAKSLRDTTTGEAIPLIFRPYHEHDGSWFWWGRGNCTTEEYNNLWKFTYSYLKDTLGVHNFIYAISPDGGQFSSKAAYLNIYPGDKYIDVLGFDYYFRNNETQYAAFGNRMTWVKEHAIAKNKVAAVTEVGDELLDMPDWHTKVLNEVRKMGHKIAYLITWRNAGTTHFYAPYRGHASVNDFLAFDEDSSTILLKDLHSNANSTAINDNFYNKNRLQRLIALNIAGARSISIENWSPNKQNFTVNVVFNSGTDISNLKPSFVSSQRSKVKLNGTVQVSSVSSVNFNLPDLKYTVIAENGKDSATYQIRLSSLTSIQNETDTEMSFFPNPAQDKVTIKTLFTPTKVDIYNLQGQLVSTLKPNGETSDINISNLHSGSYLLVVYSPNGFTVSKQLLVSH